MHWEKVRTASRPAQKILPAVFGMASGASMIVFCLNTSGPVFSNRFRNRRPACTHRTFTRMVFLPKYANPWRPKIKSTSRSRGCHRGFFAGVVGLGTHGEWTGARKSDELVAWEEKNRAAPVDIEERGERAFFSLEHTHRRTDACPHGVPWTGGSPPSPNSITSRWDHTSVAACTLLLTKPLFAAHRLFLCVT